IGNIVTAATPPPVPGQGDASAGAGASTRAPDPEQSIARSARMPARAIRRPGPASLMARGPGVSIHAREAQALLELGLAVAAVGQRGAAPLVHHRAGLAAAVSLRLAERGSLSKTKSWKSSGAVPSPT